MMKTNITQKGFILPLVIAIIIIVIGVLVYKAEKPVGSMTSSSTEKTYTNKAYNFTFNYPSNWNLVESADGKSVKIETTEMKDGFRAHTIIIYGTSTKEFGTKGTKVGVIKYDNTKMALIDSYSDPIRCLPYRYQLGTINHATTTLPIIGYGGSTMSDPAHSESAILTNKDYMILITDAVEDISNKEFEIVYSSLSLTNGVQARVPACSSEVN